MNWIWGHELVSDFCRLHVAAQSFVRLHFIITINYSLYWLRHTQDLKIHEISIERTDILSPFRFDKYPSSLYHVCPSSPLHTYCLSIRPSPPFPAPFPHRSIECPHFQRFSEQRTLNSRCEYNRRWTTSSRQGLIYCREFEMKGACLSKNKWQIGIVNNQETIDVFSENKL